MRVRVLVTRSIDQALPWVEGLRARGWPAAAVPLLGIEAVTDPVAVEAVEAAWRQLAADRYAAVMFVSPNAVERFMACRPASAAGAWPATVLAAATGPGTAQALRDAGVNPSCIVQPPPDAGAFDSEHLWPVLAQRSWQARRVLIVRGDGGRDWLSERWQAAGADVTMVEAYRRSEPRWTETEQRAVDAAIDRPNEHVWLFGSSQAIGVLVRRHAEVRAAAALATHPAIARTARDHGFARVLDSGPTIDDVVRCLESSFPGV